MTGELCSLIATHCLLGHADGENYVRELIETAKRAPRRETTRRKRIFFIHTLPNWQDSMIRMLETENRCELVGCDITFDSLMPLDPDKPFESMARPPACQRKRRPFHAAHVNAIASGQRKAERRRRDSVFCHWGASRRWVSPPSPSAGWKKRVCRRWCSTATDATAATSQTDRW